MFQPRRAPIPVNREEFPVVIRVHVIAQVLLLLIGNTFLAPAIARTRAIWKRLQDLFIEERKKGVLDVSQVPGATTAHAPGYIDCENEVIFGLRFASALALPLAAPFHVQLGQRARHGRVNGSHFLVGELFLEACLRAAPCFFGLGFVDVLGGDGHVRED